MPHTYKYPRPALTADTVLFGFDLEKGELLVLLIKRAHPPFKDRWAIPGGFLNAGEENPEEAARRELFEECGIRGLYMEQLGAFGEPGRDPREHVVTVAHLGLVNLRDQKVTAGSDASSAAWIPVRGLPEMAFDHSKILAVALARLQEKIRSRPLAFELLPKKFTILQLQSLFEAVLETRLDKRNFRKKILALGVLRPLNQTRAAAGRRQAKLFSFDTRTYRRLTKQGGEFRL